MTRRRGVERHRHVATHAGLARVERSHRLVVVDAECRLGLGDSTLGVGDSQRHGVRWKSGDGVRDLQVLEQRRRHQRLSPQRVREVSVASEVPRELDHAVATRRVRVARARPVRRQVLAHVHRIRPPGVGHRQLVRDRDRDAGGPGLWRFVKVERRGRQQDLSEPQRGPLQHRSGPRDIGQPIPIGVQLVLTEVEQRALLPDLHDDRLATRELLAVGGLKEEDRRRWIALDAGAVRVIAVGVPVQVVVHTVAAVGLGTTGQARTVVVAEPTDTVSSLTRLARRQGAPHALAAGRVARPRRAGLLAAALTVAGTVRTRSRIGAGPTAHRLHEEWRLGPTRRRLYEEHSVGVWTHVEHERAGVGVDEYRLAAVDRAARPHVRHEVHLRADDEVRRLIDDRQLLVGRERRRDVDRVDYDRAELLAVEREVDRHAGRRVSVGLQRAVELVAWDGRLTGDSRVELVQRVQLALRRGGWLHRRVQLEAPGLLARVRVQHARADAVAAHILAGARVAVVAHRASARGIGTVVRTIRRTGVRGAGDLRDLRGVGWVRRREHDQVTDRRQVRHSPQPIPILGQAPPRGRVRVIGPDEHLPFEVGPELERQVEPGGRDARDGRQLRHVNAPCRRGCHGALGLLGEVDRDRDRHGSRPGPVAARRRRQQLACRSTARRRQVDDGEAARCRVAPLQRTLLVVERTHVDVVMLAARVQVAHIARAGIAVVAVGVRDAAIAVPGHSWFRARTPLEVLGDDLVDHTLLLRSRHSGVVRHLGSVRLRLDEVRPGGGLPEVCPPIEAPPRKLPEGGGETLALVLQEPRPAFAVEDDLARVRVDMLDLLVRLEEALQLLPRRRVAGLAPLQTGRLEERRDEEVAPGARVVAVDRGAGGGSRYLHDAIGVAGEHGLEGSVSCTAATGGQRDVDEAGRAVVSEVLGERGVRHEGRVGWTARAGAGPLTDHEPGRIGRTVPGHGEEELVARAETRTSGLDRCLDRRPRPTASWPR